MSRPLWEYAEEGKLEDLKRLTATPEGVVRMHSEMDEVRLSDLRVSVAMLCFTLALPLL